MIKKIPEFVNIYTVSKNANAFCVDASNKKTNETALSWLYGYSGGGDKAKNFPKRKDFKPKEVKNEPFRIKIVCMEKRGQNGTVYRALDLDRGGAYDLREWVVEELITGTTNITNGIPDTKFIWCVANGSLNLCIEGGADHQEGIKIDKVKSGAKLKPEIGHIYKNANGEYIYLGKMYVPNATPVFDENEDKNRYAYNAVSSYVKREGVKWSLKHIYFEIKYGWEKTSRAWNIHSVKTPAFKECVGVGDKEIVDNLLKAEWTCSEGGEWRNGKRTPKTYEKILDCKTLEELSRFYTPNQHAVKSMDDIHPLLK